MDQPYGGSYPYVSWVKSHLKRQDGLRKNQLYTWLFKIPKTMAL